MMRVHWRRICSITYTFCTGGGYTQYDRIDFADVGYSRKQFVISKYNISCETVAAFRWKDGKIFGLALFGDVECEQEFLYVHLQKRAMKFESGLENENSFMIIPNEFVKDHELTKEEAQELIQPDKEYERAFRKKYPSPKTRFERIMHFLRRSMTDKKIALKRKMHHLFGRRLHSRYDQ